MLTIVTIQRLGPDATRDEADRLAAFTVAGEPPDEITAHVVGGEPVVLGGLVRGGEIATAAQYESDPSLPRHFVLLLDATGRIVSDRAGVGRALRTGAFPLTWYRYPEEG